MSTAKFLGMLVLFSAALVGCQANGRTVAMTTSGDAKMVVCPQCEVNCAKVKKATSEDGHDHDSPDRGDHDH
ncbi:MAG: hypothetical protein DHS20C16_22920 [Phycisphaerae bacterium]|nr:MAG: hypothetical protein DHS20C16_22920 [Phycisphaerae bacterium]